MRPSLFKACGSLELPASIGPNGAGKTTTFKLLSGVLRADSGEILFNGDLILGLKPHQIASRGVVMTFQSVNRQDQLLPKTLNSLILKFRSFNAMDCRTRNIWNLQELLQMAL